MVCPSCGNDIDSTTNICSCGARRVDDPSTAPIHPLPKLIYGITTILIISGAIAIQTAVTIRSLYLSEFGWQWQLLLTTFELAKMMLPLALITTFLAWRGIRLARRHPDQYGGLRMSRSSLMASLLVCLIMSTAVALRLPDVIRNRRYRQQAHTRALMYHVKELIANYRDQYGSYPEHLIDLQEMDPALRPILDAWEHPLVYTPMSAEIASRGLPVPFQNYQLASRGQDGILETGDDIIMLDGLILPSRPPERTEHQ